MLRGCVWRSNFHHSEALCLPADATDTGRELKMCENCRKSRAGCQSAFSEIILNAGNKPAGAKQETCEHHAVSIPFSETFSWSCWDCSTDRAGAWNEPKARAAWFPLRSRYLQISPDHIATDAVRCPMRAADVAIGCEFPCHRPRDDPPRESSPLIGHAPNIDQLKGIKGPTKTDQERSRQSLNLACLLGLLCSLFLCFLCGLFLLRHPPCS